MGRLENSLWDAKKQYLPWNTSQSSSDFSKFRQGSLLGGAMGGKPACFQDRSSVLSLSLPAWKAEKGREHMLWS